MQELVLNDPALLELADSVIFAQVDTERDKNAPFVDQYAIDIWPTFLVIEPVSGDVLGYWPGAASVKELKGFIREALVARDVRQASKLDPKSPLALLLSGKSAQARSQYDAAAGNYEAALKKAPADWPRRSEALHGWVSSLFNAGRADKCLDAGVPHLDEVRGMALPTDYAKTLFECARHASAAKAQAAKKAILAHVEKLVASPHPDATPDDRADALGLLSTVRRDLGDKQGAHQALLARFEILDKAAKDAPSAMAATAYDDERANTFVALGRAEEAIQMLEEREKQIPDSSEPPARLAGVLLSLARYKEALAAIERALAHAEGPRRIDHLETKAEILARLGDATGRLAVLEQIVAGYEQQAKRQSAKPQRLVTAKRRVEDAKKALARAKRHQP
jgi:tetratricopeptide (TPR) repeat protein